MIKKQKMARVRLLPDKSKRGVVCTVCGKVWNEEGEGLFQTWETRSLIKAGYNSIVCEHCQANYIELRA